MKILFRILSVLVGLMLAGNAIQFIVNPEAAAAGLGMELLTGVGASTQIGDIGAFFWVAVLAIGLGQRSGKGEWLYVAALLLGTAAVVRTIAWMLGNADLATQFIVAEIIMAGILITAARLRSEEAGTLAGAPPEA